LLLLGSTVVWVLYGGERQTAARPWLAAALQSKSASASVPESSEGPISIRIDRAPVRVLHDPHAAYSAVAVDSARDEIVLQDENLSNIMVYNRLDNTPAGASMTEPKRLIGGRKTGITNNCGVYIDPSNGDIYSITGDIADTMVIFSHEAKGNVPPMRELKTPHRTYGVAADEQAQELFVTINHPPAVLVYRKMAEGTEAPVRILEGNQTRLGDVQGIAVDTKNQLMYVANRGPVSDIREGMGLSGVPIAANGAVRNWVIPDVWYEYFRDKFVAGSGKFVQPSVNVYPLQARGNTPPMRMIQGPKTQLDWPAHISLDVEHQELFVANTLSDSVLVFRATGNGDVVPLRVLKGPKTGIKTPHGVFVDEKNQELVVANFGNHAATVYLRTADGDTAPIRKIRSAPEGTPAPMFGNIGALAYDSKRDEILAPN
jgi:DNA-binding beta-propeller fold protein YncE